MAKRPCIPFFTDQCVPDSVGKVLSAAGHDVVRLRDCMATDSADQIVAIACAANARALITHDKDFRQIAKRLGATQREYRRLHRIAFKCTEANSATRILAVLSLIELDWISAQGSEEMRMDIEISEVAIRIHR